MRGLSSHSDQVLQYVSQKYFLRLHSTEMNTQTSERQGVGVEAGRERPGDDYEEQPQMIEGTNKFVSFNLTRPRLTSRRSTRVGGELALFFRF
jgi:hypothetical protein